MVNWFLDMAIIPCHVQCSRAADAEHQRQTSYWLSSDLLREHTAQLYGCTDDFNKDADTCNVIEVLYTTKSRIVYFSSKKNGAVFKFAID